MILTWHEDAQAEFTAAAVYYETQVEGLGERFVSYVEATAARIHGNPLMPRVFDADFRKVKVDKFPFLMIYRTDIGQLQIIAVMHTSRRPDYWKERMP